MSMSVDQYSRPFISRDSPMIPVFSGSISGHGQSFAATSLLCILFTPFHRATHLAGPLQRGAGLQPARQSGRHTPCAVVCDDGLNGHCAQISIR